MNVYSNDDRADLLVDKDNIVEYLLDKGLINNKSIVDGKMQIFDVSRKNRNIKLSSKIGRSLFLKQANPYNSNDDTSIKRESLLYAMMQNENECKSLVNIAPKIYDYDEKRNIMITEFVPGYSWNQYLLTVTKMNIQKDLVVCLGRMIATYHQAFEKMLANKKLSFLPKTFTFKNLLLHPGPELFINLSSANMELLKLIQKNPKAYDVLEEIFANWTSKTLIHGDLKFDNIIITSNRKTHKSIITDWEMANVGDPAWDVGSIFQEFIRSWLYSLPLTGTETAEELLSVSKVSFQNMQLALRSFWNNYIEIVQKDPKLTNDLLINSTKYCAARLLQSAYEMLHSQSQMNNITVYMVQIALNILVDVNSAAIHLLGIPFKLEL